MNDLFSKLESWNDIRNMKDEDIYVDTVTRFYRGDKLHEEDIKFMIEMIKKKAGIK